ncbi:MAG: two pore domain potassium channel family protein [Rhizobiaceae bacterium]|nr:MAG: two pore domain potassium channel family protein [Rhizobiaceae bacterium]
MSVQAQLVHATGIVVVTVLTHLVGLAILLALLRRHKRMRTRLLTAVGNALVVLSSAIGLFALHTVEIWTWALAYRHLDLLPDFEQALYFSTSTYVTIGYGDIVLPVNGRIFGAIEGANGIILLGWSTAFFFGIVDRLKLLERELSKD